MADQRDLAAGLLGIAREDCKAAKVLLKTGSSPAIVGFHCQQAVEKALKAVLVDKGL